MQKPEIATKPELTIVGMRAAFIHALSPDATNLEVIGPLWTTFASRAGSVAHRIDTTMYGIIYGEPAEERSHPEELQYIAGVPVRSRADLPGGMIAWTVPETTFAIFVHRGPIHAIGETVEFIYRTWLPGSGYAHSGVADVEVYDERFCPESEGSEMEYWISVTRSAAE